MFSAPEVKPLSCNQCKNTFAELDQDSCVDCVPHLGAKLNGQPMYRTALGIMANHNSAMSSQLDQQAFHKVYTFFSRAKEDALLVLPSVKSFTPQLQRYLATLSPTRRAEHFWSHCFPLRGGELTSGQLISVKGNVINVVSGTNGPVALEHMGQRYQIVSFYQSQNGNYCIVISGFLYPYLLLKYTNSMFVWHPFLYLLNMPECSNFLKVFRDSQLYASYTDNCRDTYTMLVPRNDTFTKECVEFLAEQSEQERFIKNHIIKGYVLPATEELGDSLEKLAPVGTLTTEYGTRLFFKTLFNESGVMQKALYPLDKILAKARIVHSFTLARGVLLVIDRPLDEFPDELTIVPSNQ